MRRELRVVSTGEAIGAVVRDGEERRLEGDAEMVLAHRIRQLNGDVAKVVDEVMQGGWSNGYLAFYPIPPESPLS